MFTYEVGFDFGNDWKGLNGFNDIDSAYIYYLEKLKDEYCKLNRLSHSLCIKETSTNTKFFLVEERLEL